MSHERIYQFIWEDKRKKGSLYLDLRNRGRRYKKRSVIYDKRGTIPNRTDISQISISSLLNHTQAGKEVRAKIIIDSLGDIYRK